MDCGSQFWSLPILPTPLSFGKESLSLSWGCAGMCFWLANQCTPSPYPWQWPQHWACSPIQDIKASSPGLLLLRLLSFSLGLPLAGKWNISSCSVLLGHHVERSCLRKTAQRLTVVRGEPMRERLSSDDGRDGWI